MGSAAPERRRRISAVASVRATRSRSRLEPAAGLSRWREVLAAADWASLRASPAYWGLGVPRGNGAPVLLIPGFMGSDRHLMELYYWLIRIGYRPHYCGFAQADDCPDERCRVVMQTLARVHRQAGQPVHLIGYSLGGTIARAVAARRPKQVAQVITLASPVRAARVHPSVLEAARALREGPRGDSDCLTGGCNCEFVSLLNTPLPARMPRTAIYSKSDGVVDWRCCLDASDSANVEVRSTHRGLPFNVQAYRAIARALAQPVLGASGRAGAGSRGGSRPRAAARA